MFMAINITRGTLPKTDVNCSPSSKQQNLTVSLSKCHVQLPKERANPTILDYPFMSKDYITIVVFTICSKYSRKSPYVASTYGDLRLIPGGSCITTGLAFKFLEVTTK